MYDAEARWKEIKEMPVHNFRSIQATEIFNRADAWHLPEPYVAVVRMYDDVTGNVTEKAFKRLEAANKFIDMLNQEDAQFTVYNDDEMYTSVGMEVMDEVE